MAESTRKDPGADVGGISSVGSVVTARELRLVTTLGLSLLDGQAVGDREANLAMAPGDGIAGERKGSGGKEEEREAEEVHIDDFQKR